MYVLKATSTSIVFHGHPWQKFWVGRKKNKKRLEIEGCGLQCKIRCRYTSTIALLNLPTIIGKASDSDALSKLLIFGNFQDSVLVLAIISLRYAISILMLDIS